MTHKPRPVIGTKIWVAGDEVGAGDLNREATQYINFVSNRRPNAQADNRTKQNTINNNEWKTVELDTVMRDSEGGFDNAGNYTCQLSGWYYVCGGVVFTNNGTNQRGVRFAVNGLAVSGATVIRPDTAIAAGVNLTRMIPLVEGNVLNLQAWQDSGGTLDTNLVDPEISYMDILFYSQFFGFGV